MQIQIDSREKTKAIKLILSDFDKQGVKYYISKLYVGDYMSLDNPRVVIDRKQNLSELCSNVCQQHERFRAELIRAKENDIKVIILCEHGHGIETLPDVSFWRNPRSEVRKKVNGQWITVKTKAMTGETLCKVLTTLERKYGCTFLFCEKKDTGKRIVELLSEVMQ